MFWWPTSFADTQSAGKTPTKNTAKTQDIQKIPNPPPLVLLGDHEFQVGKILQMPWLLFQSCLGIHPGHYLAPSLQVMWFVGVSTRGWEEILIFQWSTYKNSNPPPQQKKTACSSWICHQSIRWKPINWNYAFHDMIPKFPLKILRFSPPSRVRTPQVSPSFKPLRFSFQASSCWGRRTTSRCHHLESRSILPQKIPSKEIRIVGVKLFIS